MYWLQPPPYLRRIGAVALIVAAIAWDLRTSATEPYPVAARLVEAGAAITAEDVAWVQIPVGTFPTLDLAGAVAARPIQPGEPVTAGALSTLPPVPEGWWTVPMEIGEVAARGDEVMLVATDPPLTTFGIVVSPQVGDRYSLAYRPASVAVPPESVAAVAEAERSGSLVTAARTVPPQQ